MASDIGDMLFTQLLGMTQYPGAPFTGNIYRDIVMFLIVPTIFIIMVLYIMSGRVIPDKRIRVMLGVGAYMFIIASGFYPVFALLAGPYFIFLIFILGLLGFALGHFKRGGNYSGGNYSGGGGHIYDGEGGGFSKKVGMFEQRRRHQLEKDIKGFEDDIKNAEKRLEHLPKTSDRAIQAENDRIANAEREIRKLKRLLDRDFMD